MLMKTKTALDYPMLAAGATTGMELPRHITGATLAHWLPHLTPVQRGVVGGSLYAGHLRLVLPTLEMSAPAARTNTTYAWAASKLSPWHRFEVWEGCRPLIEPKPKAPTAPADADEALVAIAGRVGIDHVLAVLARFDQVAVAA